VTFCFFYVPSTDRLPLRRPPRANQRRPIAAEVIPVRPPTNHSPSHSVARPSRCRRSVPGFKPCRSVVGFRPCRTVQSSSVRQKLRPPVLFRSRDTSARAPPARRLRPPATTPAGPLPLARRLRSSSTCPPSPLSSAHHCPLRRGFVSAALRSPPPRRPPPSVAASACQQLSPPVTSVWQPLPSAWIDAPSPLTSARLATPPPLPSEWTTAPPSCQKFHWKSFPKQKQLQK
jgi:hypothetical protein